MEHESTGPKSNSLKSINPQPCCLRLLCAVGIRIIQPISETTAITYSLTTLTADYPFTVKISLLSSHCVRNMVMRCWKIDFNLSTTFQQNYRLHSKAMNSKCVALLSCIKITEIYALFCFVFQGKEGAFMVRDSRQAGVYTVSVFTKAPG